MTKHFRLHFCVSCVHLRTLEPRACYRNALCCLRVGASLAAGSCAAKIKCRLIFMRWDLRFPFSERGDIRFTVLCPLEAERFSKQITQYHGPRCTSRRNRGLHRLRLGRTVMPLRDGLRCRTNQPRSRMDA